ncbi:hypothetical protein P9112_003215 [Eukaryota sp. TZLM1-RC]
MSDFHQLLTSDKVPLDKLRQLSYKGLGSNHRLRSLVWSLLLGSITPDSSKWVQHVRQRRAIYCEYVQDFWKEDGPQEESECDHPLSSCTNSSYASFFEDRRLLYEICKDLKRTHTSHPMFTLSSHLTSNDNTPSNTRTSPKSMCTKTATLTETSSTSDGAVDSLLSLIKSSPVHCVLLRVLFLFAKLNPAVKYIQGMNELLSPLFYTFSCAREEEDGVAEEEFYNGGEFLKHLNVAVTSVEADVFFCFTQLMSRQRDNFIEKMDHDSKHGIRSRMLEIHSIISRFDPDLHCHFNNHNIDPQYFALRWVSVLLSQDFELNDCIRIWDSLFSYLDGERNFILYICSSMILEKKNELINADFANLMAILQHYQTDNLEIVLDVARKLYIKDGELLARERNRFR